MSILCTWSSVFSEYESTHPAPSDACEPSLGFVSADPHLDRAPFASGLVASLILLSSRNRPDPFRPVPCAVPVPFVPSRPVPTRRLVSPRLASSRFATARPYRRCGRAVTLIDRYRVTKYGPRPFLLERAL